MITVREVMSTDLLTMNETATVAQARQAMSQGRIRHIPVVNGNGQFVGLLTQRDVLAASLSTLADTGRDEREDLESHIPVREVMQTDLAVVEEDTDLREAAEYLLDHKIGCLPVVTEGALVGIITEADFLRLVVHLLNKLAA